MKNMLLVLVAFMSSVYVFAVTGSSDIPISRMNPWTGLFEEHKLEFVFTKGFVTEEIEISVDYSTDLYTQILALSQGKNEMVDRDLVKRIELPSGPSVIKKLYFFHLNTKTASLLRGESFSMLKSGFTTQGYVPYCDGEKELVDHKSSMGLRKANVYEVIAYMRYLITTGNYHDKPTQISLPLGPVKIVTEKCVTGSGTYQYKTQDELHIGLVFDSKSGHVEGTYISTRKDSQYFFLSENTLLVGP